MGKIYLPGQDSENGVIPQDASWFCLDKLDIRKYKGNVASVLKDYSPVELNGLQVSKQADVMVLFSLFPHLFDKKTEIENWNYYEGKTLHDSSLSYTTYCITACDMERAQEAYEMFQKAIQVDLGENRHSSEEGIHMAALAGIWQSFVMGFGGLRIAEDGILSINPVLPEEWDGMVYRIFWKKQNLEVKVGKDGLEVYNKTGTREVPYYHKGEIRKC